MNRRGCFMGGDAIFSIFENHAYYESQNWFSDNWELSIAWIRDLVQFLVPTQHSCLLNTLVLCPRVFLCVCVCVCSLTSSLAPKERKQRHDEQGTTEICVKSILVWGCNWASFCLLTSYIKLYYKISECVHLE